MLLLVASGRTWTSLLVDWGKAIGDVVVTAFGILKRCEAAVAVTISTQVEILRVHNEIKV
jgi:hypothetical protein